MVYNTSGEIIRIEYDPVVDIDRISFKDSKLKTENYIEIPRSLATFDEGESIKVDILDQDKNPDKKSKPKIIMNTTLFLLRQSKANEDDSIFQFSSGGLIYRITTKNSKLFSLRGNRKYKLVVS